MIRKYKAVAVFAMLSWGIAHAGYSAADPAPGNASYVLNLADGPTVGTPAGGPQGYIAWLLWGWF
jgi:hypothetical protein